MTKSNSSLPNLLIALPAVCLLLFGILVIYSSDSRLATQQALFALGGLFLFWVFSRLGFESLEGYINYFYFGVLILLLVLFILGIESRGSIRWISIFGLRFQPSEFAKPILILFLARYWMSHTLTWRNIFKSLLWLLPMFGLIFKQPDLGTALTLLAIWAFILIGANVPFVKLAVMTVASVALLPLTWHFLRDYQKDRILSFLSPAQDPLGVGYNVIQAMIAVGSGELFGRGLGRGTQSRLQFLPEFRTDFIFASIAEEFGLVGSLLVLVLYGLLIFGCFKIISSSSRRLGGLIIFGVLGMLFFQIVVNVGMNMGILPITGITLPLLSYGGSSVVSVLISLGFVASIGRLTKKKTEESISFD